MLTSSYNYKNNTRDYKLPYLIVPENSQTIPQTFKYKQLELDSYAIDIENKLKPIINAGYTIVIRNDFKFAIYRAIKLLKDDFLISNSDSVIDIYEYSANNYGIQEFELTLEQISMVLYIELLFEYGIDLGHKIQLIKYIRLVQKYNKELDPIKILNYYYHDCPNIYYMNRVSQVSKRISKFINEDFLKNKKILQGINDNELANALEYM